jgi:hypothetical protein
MWRKKSETIAKIAGIAGIAKIESRSILPAFWQAIAVLAF